MLPDAAGRGGTELRLRVQASLPDDLGAKQFGDLNGGVGIRGEVLEHPTRKAPSHDCRRLRQPAGIGRQAVDLRDHEVLESRGQETAMGCGRRPRDSPLGRGAVGERREKLLQEQRIALGTDDDERMGGFVDFLAAGELLQEFPGQVVGKGLER